MTRNVLIIVDQSRYFDDVSKTPLVCDASVSLPVLSGLNQYAKMVYLYFEDGIVDNAY